MKRSKPYSHKKEKIKESLKDMLFDTFGTLGVMGIVLGIIFWMLSS